MGRVLAVVVNWRRPGNIPAVVNALRAQTVPLKIVLVDNSSTLCSWRNTKIDDLFTVRRNLGPACRYLPPLAETECQLTYFQPDDWLPGPRHVEHLLETAEKVNGEFVSIGQDGRRVDPRRGRIIRRRSRLGDQRQRTDFLVSSELVRTDFVHHAVNFRCRMIEAFGDKVSLFEDDLFLSFGIQWLTGFASYLTPKPESEQQRWRVARLPSPHALCSRANHDEIRTEFVRQAMKLGWRSLCMPGLPV